MSTAGTIELLARALAAALAPLERRLSPEEVDGFFARLGFQFPAGVMAHPNLKIVLQGASGVAGQLSPLLASLSAAINAGDLLVILAQGAATMGKLGELFAKLDSIGLEVGALEGTIPGVPPGDLSSFAASLPRAMMELAIVEHFERVAPELTAVLAIAGIIDRHAELDVSADPARIPFEVKRLKLNHLTDILRTPLAYAQSLYGWGGPGFDAKFLLQQIAELAGFFGLPALINPGVVGSPSLDMAFFELALDTTTSPPGLRIDLRVPIKQDFSNRVPLSQSGWFGEINVKGKFDAGLVGRIDPPAAISLKPPAGTFTGSVSAGFAAQPTTGATFTLIGMSGGTRLEARRIAGSLGLDLAWDAASGSAKGEPAATLEISGGKLVLDLSAADSFVKALSGGANNEIAFALAAKWTPKQGIRFEGSSTLEIAVPTHVTVGPVSLDVIHIIVGLDPGGVPLELSAAISSKLGPLSVSIDRIGLLGKITFPNGKGNLGPLNIGFEFKPPNGVGLEVNAGGFTGGGFLRLDPDKGEYEGGLELTFLGTISVRAIGVLSTRMPDGSEGFSLVIIIVAEFPPIQLSWGFTLVGVGGLLGLNRTVLLEQLQSGVHDGSLNSILFPTDIVANSARIISDLKRVFPPRDGRFLVGPMAKLGWGTPTLISLSLGLILELPRPMFAIIGVLHMALPTEDLPLLHLQVSFAGSIDFESGQLQFDASLFDSRMGTFTLTGDMAVRAYWKDNANFLLTVGGFHPAYTPPPMNLPELARLGMVLFQGNPHVSAQVYFAVTSNSVQLGARVEVYYGIDLFNVYGFLGLDVLINFNPFHFVAEITAEIGVRTGDTVLFAIQLQLLLEGPTPWHARGTGSFRIGFIIKVTVSAGFDVTFGDARETRLPPVDVLAEVVKALSNLGNWRPQLPSGSNQHVTLRELPDPSQTLVLHPFGALEITQKLVPLHVAIQRFGSRASAAGSVFTLADAKLGAADAGSSNTREQFAPAQFFNLSDAEKLSRPSFADYDAGIVIDGDLAPRTDLMRPRDVVYELIYLPEHHPVRLTYGLAVDLAGFIVRGSAVAQSPVSHAQRSVSVLEERASLAPERYAVVSTTDLTLHSAHLVFDTATAADQAVQSLVNERPELFGAIQVLPAAAIAGRPV